MGNGTRQGSSDELLRLPFLLPGSEDVVEDAEEIVRTIAEKARRLKEKIKQECTVNAGDDFPLPEILQSYRHCGVKRRSTHLPRLSR